MGGALTNFDIVIFAGGSATKQGETLGDAGRAKVEEFVGNGGGYIGICAGAYKHGKVLCISPHPEQTDGLAYIITHAVNWGAPATCCDNEDPPITSPPAQ